ncbi:CheY-like chemotaxis protein [Brevundimonas vesicularis]|uniref:CheY-like chemotaxis protein n=1 Tax=Brevundimonas vesicularis TaxID=41276 RepID=A0A7W9FW11_BREVE|nr:hypothetical protein [Brevundimonas vesicularis]MBB5772625.1 CheY-like chemotaxis protein [Brevundimonas vesicularis]
MVTPPAVLYGSWAAAAMVEQVESYLAAGMDAVVSKPVDLKVLLTIISEVMSAKT